MIWFMSDTHYNHSNMCYGVSKWEDKEKSTRRFDNLEKMNDAIVKSINDCVDQNDEIYFLGDWSFGGVENILIFFERLNCRNINFIPGNHDHHVKKNKILREDNVYGPLYAKELFEYLPELTSIVIKKQKFILCHYPLDQWEDMDRGSIHLHGHCHGYINNCETNTKYKRMDVGLDWKEFRPYSLDEILKIMEKRKIKIHIKN